MEKTMLKAMERNGKPNRIRKAGFVPGVLSGADTASDPVQFEGIALNKIISKHGANAKVWIEQNGTTKFGFIKEIQADPVERKLIHVSIQLVTENQEIKMQLPIVFRGQAELDHKMLQVQVCKPEVEVEGKTSLLPDMVEVEVAERKSGENITAVDFHLPSEVKILDPENEVYAIIKDIKAKVEEAEPAEEPKPAE